MTKIEILRDFINNGRTLKRGEVLSVDGRWKKGDINQAWADVLLERGIAKVLSDSKSDTNNSTETEPK
jgi:hypothetical protein